MLQCKSIDGIKTTQVILVGTFKNGDKLWTSLKDRDFTEQLNDNQFLKDPAPISYKLSMDTELSFDTSELSISSSNFCTTCMMFNK